MNNNYRIHTNINEENILHINLKQDFDFLEVLSLKIGQEDLYKLDKSNYGVIVGRVLANDAFGIPNAKVSVFIELSDEDNERSEIFNIYNYKSTKDTNNQNVRYNLLPDFKDDECYRTVGTFPNKRLVLDDNTMIEVYDKYYKYTTVTNNAGDYMFYGVPTGSTMLHVDIDLSDIGILSQKPRDFYYKGYNQSLFDNANQFKESTNLNSLTQIISQNQGLYVYPFFASEEDEEAAITRCDIQVQYKFEPTCVFFGSIVTDSSKNNFGHYCDPSNGLGRNSELIATEGTIEMIRKTIDGLTEEFQIQGNKLIDGDGVWCYQIPMNLDYVGTDEYGNVIPTDNPNKGIPTRTRVRFRFSIDESENDGISRHRAKYLVPNNPLIDLTNNGSGEIKIPQLIEKSTDFDKHYNFGSSTIEDDYRNLYWNNVYSVKNYIPRLQNNNSAVSKHYSGIKSVNYANNLNPFPFNKARIRLLFGYRVLCIIMTVVISIIYALNVIISFLDRFCIPWPISWCPFTFSCISFANGLSEDEEDAIVYVPGCDKKGQKNTRCDAQGKGKCRFVNDMATLKDKIEQSLAQEYETINLDFYNDWVNGTLYFPLWWWKKTKKKKYLFGLFHKRAVNSYCECDKNWKRLKIVDTCGVTINNNSDKGSSWHTKTEKNTTFWGVIKNVINKNGLNIYYYSCGVIPNANIKESKDFLRLFATDIILLGSFNDCNLNGMPKPYLNLPPSTSNIPPLAPIIQGSDDESDENEGTSMEKGSIKITGMDWEHDPTKQTPQYGKGLFFGMDCTSVETLPKTCINLNRISELGVSIDSTYNDWFRSGNLKQEEVQSDGLITNIEIDDEETRAMFATLNHNGLHKLVYDKATGYKFYDLTYVFPTNFDGRQGNNIIKKYTKNLNRVSTDLSDKDYLYYRFGSRKRIYYPNTNDKFPLYNNSFYFYFGLNVGKTAIDKFNSLFNAECFKNNKFPFTINVSKSSAASCLFEHTKNGINCNQPIISRFGVIEVSLPDIKMPYSYTLSFGDGQEIISETNINLNKLVFGVEYDKNNGYATTTSSDTKAYIGSDDVIYKKNGLIKPFNNGTIDNNVYLTNNNYSITITDSNGKTMVETIVIAQPLIALESSSEQLGANFIPKQDETLGIDSYTKPDDIYCSDLQGNVKINGVVIDGESYIIKDIYLNNGDDNNISLQPIIDDNITSQIKVSSNGNIYDNYVLYISNGQTNYYIDLKIYVESWFLDDDIRENAWNSLIYDACLNGGSGKTHTNNDFIINCSSPKTINFDKENGVIEFNLWIPGSFNFVITQLCCENGKMVLSDNSSSNIINVENGDNFDALLNEVPINFILKQNDNKEKVQYDVNDAYRWFKVNNEKSYNFPNLANNKTLWSNYINYDTEEIDGKQYPSKDTKINALVYKFDSLFKLSKATYFVNDDNSFELTTNGGGSKVLKQGVYPSYDNMSNTYVILENNGKTLDKNGSVINKWTLDSFAQITCDDSHPNIISNNYKSLAWNHNWLMSNNNRQHSPFIKILSNEKKYGFNPLIANNDYQTGAKGYCNYFAAFTNNGGVGEYKGKQFQKYPNTSLNKPISYGEETIASYEEKPFESVIIPNSKIISEWFKTLFVDRRISYICDIITSSNMTIEEGDNESINNGRFAIQIINGVPLSYDENYNLIGDSESANTEYYFQDNSDGMYSVYNETSRKLFYSCDLVTDYHNFYDLKYAIYNDEECLIDKWMITEFPKMNFGIENISAVTSNIDEITGSEPIIYSANNEVASPYFGKKINDKEVVYPSISYADICNIPITNSASFSIESCSYDILTDVNNDNENISFDAITSPSEKVEFSVDCRNFFILESLNDIDTSINDSIYNVLCDTQIIDRNKLVLKPGALRMSFSLSNDIITDMEYTSLRPLLLQYENLEDLKNDLHYYKYLKNPSDIYDEIFKSHYTDGKTYPYSINDSETIDKITKTFDSSYSFEYKYFYDINEPYDVLKQGSSEAFKKIMVKTPSSKYSSNLSMWWSSNKAYESNEFLKLSNKNKYLMLFGGREYIGSNYNSENLEKITRVYNFGNIYEMSDLTFTNYYTDNNVIYFDVPKTIIGDNIQIRTKIHSIINRAGNIITTNPLNDVSITYDYSKSNNDESCYTIKITINLENPTSTNYVLQLLFLHYNGLLYGGSFIVTNKLILTEGVKIF